MGPTRRTLSITLATLLGVGALLCASSTVGQPRTDQADSDGGLLAPTPALATPQGGAGPAENRGCAGVGLGLFTAGCVCTTHALRVTTVCDTDGDGVEDYRVVQRLDGQRRLRSVKVVDASSPTPQLCARTWYDDAGHIRRESGDDDCDGEAERVTSFRYTDAGYPLSEWGDIDGDRESDYSVRWLYDRDGLRTRIAYRYDDEVELPDTTCRYDPPCPPPYDTCWESEVCWEGDRPEPWPRRQLSVALVTERGLVACDAPSRCDGRTELCGCDGSQRVVFSGADLDGDGLVDEVRGRTWDEDGGYLERIDVGADGVVEVENRFDAHGQLLEASWHDDYDDVVDRAMRYTRDAGGALVRAETVIAGRVTQVEEHEQKPHHTP